MTRAIVSVVAKDTVGIIAYVAGHLASKNINVLDISQTVMQDYFTMIMLVDLSGCKEGFDDIRSSLHECGEAKGLVIHIQRQEIFDAMHRV